MNILKKTITAALFALMTASAFAAVDINKANQAELEGIKGIGPAMSARILEARKSGDFKDWADLHARVKGFGDARSARLSADGLTVNGSAFKGGDGAQTMKAPKGQKPHKGDKMAKAEKSDKASDKAAEKAAKKAEKSPKSAAEQQVN